MMLERYMERFAREMELEMDLQDPKRPGTFVFPLSENLSAHFSENNGMIILDSTLGALLEQQGEDFYRRCLQANLFGQDTYGATLGINGSGKMLTLSHAIDYNVDYEEFKELLEDFLNAVEMWHAELEATE